MDEHVLFRDFLGFGDQTLLETLNLLDELIRFDIGRLELSPPVDIEWLLEFIIQVLDLLLLFKKLLLKQVDLTLQIRDARCLLL